MESTRGQLMVPCRYFRPGYGSIAHEPCRPPSQTEGLPTVLALYGSSPGHFTVQVTAAVDLSQRRSHPRLAYAQIENPHQRERGNREERARNSGNFRAREYAEEDQQRMQLDALFHQMRRENVILEYPVDREKDQHREHVRACHAHYQQDQDAGR